MRKQHIGNEEIAYLDEGKGPVVLLIHGFPDDHQVWRNQIPALVAAGFRVLAPDTRGCGDSSIPGRVEDYRLSEVCADLAGLLELLAIPDAFVVGHDWGAAIAWQFSMRFPQRVKKLCVLSAGHPKAFWAGGLEQLLRSSYVLFLSLRGIAEWVIPKLDWLFLRCLSGVPREIERWKANLSRAGRLTAALNYYRAYSDPAAGNLEQEVSVPVLGIWSTGDRFLTQEQMTASARYVDAPWTYREIAEAHHWIQLAAPRAINEMLIEYFQAESRQPPEVATRVSR
jgi:pimeloyl-ACP methyl ester carboxylesterase